MFTRFLSFALVVFVFTSSAFASTKNGFKAAYDELNYSLTVDWDQKDQAFFNAQSEKFTKELVKLQKEGLTNQEMLEAVLNEVEDKNLARDIQATYSLVSINAMSPEEAREQVKNLVEKSHKKGASWAGAVVLGMVLMLAIIAVVGIVYQEEIKKEGEKCYMAWKCNDYCGLTGCKQVCGEECI